MKTKTNIPKELAAMGKMTAGQLREKHRELFGEDSRSGNRQWLFRRCSWRLQALAEGNLSDRARRRAKQLARDVDNRHYPHTLLRTMNYPLDLVWTKLQELGTATREELSQAEGVDTSKLPIVNLVRQLERLGLAEEREGRVFAIKRGGPGVE